MFPLILYATQDSIPIVLNKVANKTCIQLFFYNLKEYFFPKDQSDNLIKLISGLGQICKSLNTRIGFAMRLPAKNRCGAVAILSNQLRYFNLHSNTTHGYLVVQTNSEKILCATMCKTQKNGSTAFIFWLTPNSWHLASSPAILKLFPDC